MLDQLDELRQSLTAALEELNDEAARLRAALVALDGAPALKSTSASRAPTVRATSRRSGQRRVRGASASGQPPHARSRRAGVDRRDALLSVFRTHPGITVGQASAELGMKGSTLLYPVAKRMAQDGLLTREGRAYYPVSGSDAIAA